MEGHLFLSTESRRCGTLGTRLHQQPPECLASELGLPLLDLSVVGEVAECSVRLRITYLSATLF
jgi:hypothetical protein